MEQIITEKKQNQFSLLPDSDLYFKEISFLLAKEKKIIIPKQYSIGKNKFELINIEGNFFNIIFKQELYSLWLTPIKIKYLIKNTFQEYEIYSQYEFLNIPKTLNMEYPQIIYTINNNTKSDNYIFSIYIGLLKVSNNIYIKDTIVLKMISKEKFNLLKSHNNTFFNIYFNSAKDFDKNYYLYFSEADNDKDIFIVYYSEKRKNLSNHFKLLETTGLRKYYGPNSIGKSLILIGTFKYTFNHSYFGTLYINCKTLEYYSWKDPSVCKRIILDEIVYLFYGDYDNYYQASNYIINFELIAEKKDKNFWSLIHNLFRFFKNTKIYYISFDQYNINIDPFEQLKEIWNTKYEMTKIQISIIVLSTLNNPEIIKYKARQLLNENSIDEIPIWHIEIEDFDDIKELKFYDDEYNEYLEYVGRNMYNYNQLKALKKTKSQIDVFIEQKKNDIKNNLYLFFNIEEKINLIQTQLLYKFLSFSVNSSYSLEQFKKIYYNIPFEYFRIYKTINIKECIEIEYRYPMLNDIFNDIYSEIILNGNIQNILVNKIFDAGAKGELLEKIIIQNFTPNEYNNYNINFFGEFIVSKTYTIDKFLPKKTEKLELNKDKIINVKNSPFLLKQKNFGGKAFDIIIVDFFGNQAIFYVFQITGFKKKLLLIELNTLKTYIESMIKYMENYFTFEIACVYYSYIFDHTKINENRIIKMCETLDVRNIKYFFYNINTHIFYDINNNKIETIKKYVNEFIINEIKKVECEYYSLNKYEKCEINKILKNIYKSNIVSYKLFNIGPLNMKDLNTYSLFCITKIKNNNECKTYMIYFYNGKFDICLLNNNENSKEEIKNNELINNIFDYYKIIIE